MTRLRPAVLSAIAVTELRLRYRRTGTLVLLLALVVLAIRFVPSPSSGYSMMVASGRRVLLTSESISLASACLGAVALGLFGFFSFSTAVGRDAMTGVGRVIAATPVTNAEYVLGKFAAHVVALTGIAAAFMVNVMIMHRLRGEGPVIASVYVSTYCLVLLPTIVFVATCAIAWECIGFLSGRVGDCLYFVVWTTILGLGAFFRSGRPFSLVDGADLFGMLYMLHRLDQAFPGIGGGIGVMPFNRTLVPFVLPVSSGAGTAYRVLAALAPLPLLGIAVIAFPRFRNAQSHQAARRRWSALAQVVARALAPLRAIVARTFMQPVRGLAASAKAAAVEAGLTYLIHPSLLAATIASAILAAASPTGTVRSGLVPLGFCIAAIGIADIAVRDSQRGTIPMIYALPGARGRYVAVKFMAALMVLVLMELVCLVRLLPGGPASLVCGSLFTAALAVTLGVLSRSSKPFVAFFLLLVFFGFTARSSARLDFGGWNGAATPSVRLGYVVIAAFMVSVAEFAQRRQAATVR